MPQGQYPLYPGISFNAAVNKLFGLSVMLSLPIGDTKEIMIQIPAGFARLVDQKIFFLTSAIDFTVFEGVTAKPGTPLPTYCIDRNITSSSSAICTLGPTGVSGGTPLIGMEHFGLTTDIIGGNERDTSSIAAVTLKQSTNYLIRLTNVGSEAISNLHYLVAWAE